ncbi:hypothetical protein FQN51_000873 [Onygenales sp. PD_10]|nr:hypothetical protein FQN51_000873 [Onygenales sp. PD_10]
MGQGIIVTTKSPTSTPPPPPPPPTSAPPPPPPAKLSKRAPATSSCSRSDPANTFPCTPRIGQGIIVTTKSPTSAPPPPPPPPTSAPPAPPAPPPSPPAPPAPPPSPPPKRRASPTRPLLRERELDDKAPFTQGCQSKTTERLPPSVEIPWCPPKNSRLMARERVRDAKFPDEGEEEIKESPTRVISEFERRGHPTTYPNPDYWPLKPTPLKPPTVVRESPEDTRPETPTDQDLSVSPIEQRAQQDTDGNQPLEPNPTDSPRPPKMRRPVVPPTEKRVRSPQEETLTPMLKRTLSSSNKRDVRLASWGISPDGEPKEVNSDEPDSDSENS